MNKKSILLFFLYAVLSLRSSAQVSVDHLTGAAQINIPIYTLTSGTVSVPVSLYYKGNGIRPKDVEGTAGIGWQLVAGGQVSRSVRGLPDDCTKDEKDSLRTGWMSSLDTVTNISAFTIQNDGGVTCSKETADISYMNSHFPYKVDTEPDLFYVSAPGLSCQLIYEKSSGKFKPVGYQDLVVSYTLIGGTGRYASNIASFTITNDKGVSYIFSQPQSVTETTKAPASGRGPYFNRRYYQYANGITHTDSWSLTKVVDRNGNGVNLSYSSYPATTGTDSVALYVSGSTTYSLQYRTLITTLNPCLAAMSTFNNSSSGNTLAFYYETLTGSNTSGQTLIDSISGCGRHFQFAYSQSQYAPTNFVRSFLRSFSEPGVNSPVSYQFGYKGETFVASNYYTTLLPDSTSTQRDYWGYYSTVASASTLIPSVEVNPSTPTYPRYLIRNLSATYQPAYAYSLASNNRSPDPTVIAYGSLNKIVNVNGGNTNIIYEPNDYYDPTCTCVVQAAGIRVKQIVDSVGKGSANNIIRNYTYLNPSTGLSSGKPLSMPQFAFTIPLSSTGTDFTFWNSSTALCAYDLSDDDHSIYYQYSKQSQTGAGSTLYQYTVPATFFDASATPSCSGCSTVEWTPTLTYVARKNCSVSPYGGVKNWIYAYPFLPNPNYDFERGLPVKTTSYNDGGQEVSETNYTYQRSGTPTAITAFRCDDDPDGSLVVKSYGKYTIYYNTSELTATVINKVFDSPTLLVSRSDTATYTYGSAAHKLVTKIQTSNSDNSTLFTNIKYAKDYIATSGTNANITAVYNLQQQNANIPIESYQQVTRNGVTKTTAASLSLFRDTTIASKILVLPSQQLKWIQPDGGTFAPMTISGTTLTKDPGYFAIANYDIYDNTGYPLTVDDAHKRIGTTILNHLANRVMASFDNAAYNQVAFSDFDSDLGAPAYGFTVSGTGSYTAVGSHAGLAKGIAGTQTVTSPILSKNTTAANYIFSIWVNNTNATAATLTLTLTGISTHPTVTCPAGSGWKYYEVPIAAGTLSASYTVSFTTSANITVDDILFYPDVAAASTATYDLVSHYRIAATNTNGVSAYYTNDPWGRLLYAYDQDHNIVQKNTYVTTSEVSDYSNATIKGTTVVSGVPAAFSILGVDVSNKVTVTWNFGDGSAPVNTSLSTSPSHTYTLFGTYTVTATINSPLFGPKTLTYSQVVNPNNITLSFTNGLPVGAGNLSTLVFKQGGVTKYSFTPVSISGATILQGVYTVVATISNPLAHTDYSNSLVGDNYFGCNNYTSSTILTFTYTADLSTCSTLSTVLATSHCGTPP